VTGQLISKDDLDTWMPSKKTFKFSNQSNSVGDKSSARSQRDEVSELVAITEEQFESAMAEFAKRLEASCNELFEHHARKLRPNYDGEWIVNLKVKLQRLEEQRPTASAQSDSKAASSKA
jgi:hypothetical protein